MHSCKYNISALVIRPKMSSSGPQDEESEPRQAEEEAIHATVHGQISAGNSGMPARELFTRVAR